MANSVPNILGTETAFTVSLGALATSSVGVGRQTTIVDFRTGSLFPPILEVTFQIKLGTSPSAGNVYFYWIAANTGGTTVRSDNAGASDAGLTRISAKQVHQYATKSSPASGDLLSDTFIVDSPTPLGGLLIVHDTGVNLDATNGNHYVAYATVTPQVQ